MSPEVIRSPDCANSPRNARAEDIALALMGVGGLDPQALAEAASWDRAGAAIVGRAAIGAALAGLAPAQNIAIEQVVTHGKAGSVTGRITRAGETLLFCHVIRFTSAAAREIAQMVSFEHAGRR